MSELASLEDVKRLLNIPQTLGAYDGPLAVAVSMANAILSNLTQRSLEETEYTDVFQKIREGEVISLTHSPIADITSVKVREVGFETDLDAAYEIVNSDKGEIVLKPASWFPPSSYVDAPFADVGNVYGKLWDRCAVVYSSSEWVPSEAERAAAARYAIFLYEKITSGASSSRRQGSVSVDISNAPIPADVRSVFLPYEGSNAHAV